MPTTPVGLLLFVVVFIPGFVYHVRRRAITPQKSSSALIEMATLATVSLGVNLVTALGFGLARFAFADHMPAPQLLLEDPAAYGLPRLAWLLAWGTALLVAACAVAFMLASRWGPAGWVARRFTPSIVDVSAWYHTFESGPEGHYVYVGCDICDGSYVGGVLEWYSTETAETGDRSLVLAPPLDRLSDGEWTEVHGVERVIVNDRDIRRLSVSFVRSLPGGDGPDT